MKRLAALRSQSFFSVPSLHNRLRHQRNHFTKIRMDDRRAQHLVMIGDRAVAVCLAQARVTVDGIGGEIPGAIKGHQIMAVEKHHGFKRLATLELSKDERERWSQGLRRNGIEALTHPRVTGRAFNTI